MSENTGQQPHRGVLILVLGIVGVVVCGIVGIVAWVLGNGDLQKMQAGEMDPAGRDLTNAGRILGIVGTILWLLGLLFYGVVGVFALSSGAA